jgi:hypothetical protein
MAKRKRTKGQTTIYKTLHRKLKIEQHEPTKTGVELGTPDSKEVPIQLTATSHYSCSNP